MIIKIFNKNYQKTNSILDYIFLNLMVLFEKFEILPSYLGIIKIF